MHMAHSTSYHDWTAWDRGVIKKDPRRLSYMPHIQQAITHCTSYHHWAAWDRGVIKKDHRRLSYMPHIQQAIAHSTSYHDWAAWDRRCWPSYSPYPMIPRPMSVLCFPWPSNSRTVPTSGSRFRATSPSTMKAKKKLGMRGYYRKRYIFAKQKSTKNIWNCGKRSSRYSPLYFGEFRHRLSHSMRNDLTKKIRPVMAHVFFTLRPHWIDLLIFIDFHRFSSILINS